ncbi:type VI secretion system baseplate subunit TssE [Gallaecimonas kandeliae]|uniref:type VI secretion system baseplate subunit TssE n=1 Tax=Gallaecimonas kandeliae TaxID=3029055 RepID=UPI00264815A3|nr:type VI secretion system baseplate subunit TssE [Gallaecimonas kandeliae]WKE65737.1 type VI secretion system baseplate subunit TssE [Gallaecimonas kandeliae]
MPAEQAVHLSLLDRLVDGESRRQNLALLRQALRRDLENLLNARRSWLPLGKQYPELAKSTLGYGLPDFTVMEMSTEDGRRWLCEEVQETIGRFEPRLAQVQVSLRDKDAPLDRVLRLRIDAVLLAAPVPTPVSFDSELEPLNLSVTLQDNER